ncbi:MAG: helix-turn-helix domain-containing protein [Defluviitaleaceae bacterium]|nr:helix-turn-helix domain-containing protein [Defluviitaleaceae bacterium]
MIMLLRVPYYEVEERIKALEEAMENEKNMKQYMRYQVIRMLLKGDSVTVVSERLNKKRSTIYDYGQLYRKNGLEGLKIKPKSGRPRKLSKQQEQELSETVEQKTTSEVGVSSEMN